MLQPINHIGNQALQKELIKTLNKLILCYSYNLDSYKELTRQACLLRYICNSEAAWIKEVILTFGEDEQKAFATVESASKVNQSGLQEGTPVGRAA